MVTGKLILSMIIGFQSFCGNAHSTQKVHIYPKSLLPTDYGERDDPLKWFRGLPLSINWWAIRIWKMYGLCGLNEHVVLPQKKLNANDS
jgi:hypothetical protein